MGDMSSSVNDLQLAVVENSLSPQIKEESVVRLYDVGRLKADEEDFEDMDDEDENQDEDDDEDDDDDIFNALDSGSETEEEFQLGESDEAVEAEGDFEASGSSDSRSSTSEEEAAQEEVAE